MISNQAAFLNQGNQAQQAQFGQSQQNATEQLLNDRARTHGIFADNAVCCQGLKEAVRNGPNWHGMTSVQCEAVEAVLCKISRIVCGDSDFPDHYRDAIGYLQLALDEMAKGA